MIHNQHTYDIVSLQATAEREVEQDLISITFSAVSTETDSSSVQENLVTTTNEALEIAKAHRKGSQVRVATGGMHISPAYDKKGGISGYNGRSTIIVSGTDMTTISGLTAEIKGMSVDSIDFSVSPALSKRVLKKLTLEAIANFQEKALEVATAFDATGYKMVNVSVNSGGGYHRGAQVGSSMRAMSAAAAPLSVEGGKETLQASVSGSVQLVR